MGLSKQQLAKLEVALSYYLGYRSHVVKSLVLDVRKRMMADNACVVCLESLGLFGFVFGGKRWHERHEHKADPGHRALRAIRDDDAASYIGRTPRCFKSWDVIFRLDDVDGLSSSLVYWEKYGDTSRVQFNHQWYDAANPRDLPYKIIDNAYGDMSVVLNEWLRDCDGFLGDQRLIQNLGDQYPREKYLTLADFNPTTSVPPDRCWDWHEVRGRLVG